MLWSRESSGSFIAEQDLVRPDAHFLIFVPAFTRDSCCSERQEFRPVPDILSGITPEGFYWTHVAKPEWQTLNVRDVLKQREPEEGAEKKVETKPRKN